MSNKKRSKHGLGNVKDLPPSAPMWKRGNFWLTAIAVVTLVAGIVIPLYLRQLSEESVKAHLKHQLTVQPKVGTKDDLGYHSWNVMLVVTNMGPATAKTALTRLQFPMQDVLLVSSPLLLKEPTGGRVELGGAPSRGWIEIAAFNLSPSDGFIFEAELYAQESVRQELNNAWKADMFSAEFVKRFIYLVSTTGENIVPEYAGAYPIPTFPN